jgi:EcsC protein family
MLLRDVSNSGCNDHACSLAKRERRAVHFIIPLEGLLFALLILGSFIFYISLRIAAYLAPRNADPPIPMVEADIGALRNAVELLEHSSFSARLTNLLGKPVEHIGRALPAGASQAIATATTRSLEAAFQLALLTIRNEPQENSELLHRALAVASGAAGGAVGIASLPLELPVSTLIILRSILDIARSEGEDLADPEATLSCVAVLGLAGQTETDYAVKSGYFAKREILEGSVTETACFVAERGIVEEGSPVLVRLLAQIAPLFGFVVSDKAAAQTIPVIGALGGAAINYAFIIHFQAVARGHFTVRRLERRYGKEIVFAAYERLRRDLAIGNDRNEQANVNGSSPSLGMRKVGHFAGGEEVPSQAVNARLSA